jgi:hypothetical protein
MQIAREHLLAGSRFAGKQDCGIRCCDAAEQIDGRPHWRAITDWILAAELRSQGLDLVGQPALVMPIDAALFLIHASPLECQRAVLRQGLEYCELGAAEAPDRLLPIGV